MHGLDCFEHCDESVLETSVDVITAGPPPIEFVLEVVSMCVPKGARVLRSSLTFSLFTRGPPDKFLGVERLKQGFLMLRRAWRTGKH